ncbi:plasminogen-binding N-terminal domain-containing protein [Sulfurospirillum deleyianum]|uniref:Plasminogen-binding protein PgbA N-terminal domain-containing protein n=1 Tax=Sulfurospirillum deleyianum (strain ATCC 51133 / DSM 6946 / 5175) TaxID=525898 RepID=D1B3D7_SULD5|nr:plasminogen-binding N-terminal domain-containing protein [Sulfurospirillum deleyianum]ACZ12607.1 conserved hypothetical protein [Sulfurospirillum deleyianum DSM 6946]
MKKICLFLCLCLFGSFAFAQTPFVEYKTAVLDANDKHLVIADSPSFVVGASGIVKHAFDDKTSSIIARVDVISKDGNHATLRVEKFEMLSQFAFPESGIKPSKGDEVTLNYLYDRALIVTPNQETYKEVLKTYPKITWVHPDLMAAYLAKIYRPNPDKELFQKMCYQNTASLIFFAIKDKGYFVDCHNFNTIHTVAIQTSAQEMKLPFYSRNEEVESSWFSWESSEIKDYNSYYTSLIGK